MREILSFKLKRIHRETTKKELRLLHLTVQALPMALGSRRHSKVAVALTFIFLHNLNRKGACALTVISPLAVFGPFLALAPGNTYFPRVGNPPGSTKTGLDLEELGRMLSQGQVQGFGKLHRILGPWLFSVQNPHFVPDYRKQKKLRAASSGRLGTGIP